LFDVFIYGGVENPGFVTAIPINRVSDAIALAKGFKKGGSFRQVHLIRGEEDIILDLSRFSANADLSQNPFLEPGDKIYIPHAEVVVSLSGGVKYPGTYELIPGETLEDLLHYAGGTLPGSANTNFFVARVAENGKASMEEIEQSKAKDFMLKNGDNISLKSAMIVEVGATIFIEGAVFGQPPEENKPTQIPTVPVIANLPYVPGITLLNLVEKLGGPTPFARAGESYIIKKKDNSKFPVDLETLWQTRDLSMDIVLEPGDHVVIPIKELKVFVAGQVNAPGAIPFMTGLTVSDYIKAAGGINVDDGSADSIYFIDKAGNRQKASLLDEAYAGALIYVDKNAWRVTQDTFDNILVITAFVGGVVLLTNTILDLVDRVN
jgi:protein involved in polysaccharide export with SLBB domain